MAWQINIKMTKIYFRGGGVWQKGGLNKAIYSKLYIRLYSDIFLKNINFMFLKIYMIIIYIKYIYF